MKRDEKISRQIVVIALLFSAFSFFISLSYAQDLTYSTLTQLSISADTGEKPQSKVWTYDGHWWAVLPNSSGTHLWKLVGSTWTNVLTLSTATNTHADAKVVGDVVHILLYRGTSSELVSVEYVPTTDTYQLWTTRPASVSLTLDSGVETATIDIDSDGRMWLASDASTDINVRWSDSPYSTWSSAITLDSGVGTDDICVVTAFDGKIGVLWSDQVSDRFGFRVHTDGADPNTWSADEVPASQSALSVGGGMADDHLNVAVASDGTIYAAVKTSYDAGGYPKIALLIRRSAGPWDNLYEVDQSGTRGIVLLNDDEDNLMVVYTSSEGYNNIVYKETSTSTISFGSRQTLMSGSFNNATSTKQNYNGEIVILAASSTHAAGVLGTQGLVGHWQMEENGGGTIVDASFYGNDGTLYGNPGWITGKVGDYALDLDGAGDYALVPDDASLDITDAITLAAWVKPGEQATQYIIKKAIQNGIPITEDGYELSLSNPGKVFVRFNQATSINAYRLDSTTDYPTDGNTWMHIAATFDGTYIRIYINGVEEGTPVSGLSSITANNLSLAIGAQSNGGSEFQGQIDDARVYNRALSAVEIEALATSTTPPEAPTATAATGITTTGFTANWNPVAGADDYRLDVATDDLFTSFVTGYNDLTVAGISSPVTGLSANTTYYYRVRAVNTAGTSGNSNTITVTTLVTMIDFVAHWKMDENGGTTLVDASTYNNQGTIAGSPIWITGQDGLALDFNGSSQYTTVPDADILDISTNAITLAVWIKPDITGTQRIIRKVNTTTNRGYSLFLSANNYFSIKFNDDNNLRVDTQGLYSDHIGEWIHIAATYDGITIRTYFKGIADNTLATPFTILDNSEFLSLGARLPNGGSSANGNYFNGAMDDARVYNRALSDSEILTLATPPQPETLVGHWAMEEGSGTAVIDSSTYNNDGTTVGGPTWGTGIIGDYALNFDYVDDYVSVPDDASLDITAAITLAAWIKPDKQGTLSIIKKNGGGTGYELYCGSAGTVYARLNENSTYRAISTMPYPTDGTTWMHVAATYDGTNMKMYIDGKLEHTVAGPTSILVNDNELRIARDAAGTKYFDGQIDDARVYNRALNQSEIEALAFIPGGPLVGHWAMEEGSGTVLDDSSEYENDADITGSPAWVSGIKGLALDLDGANDYALAPDDPSLDITDEITLAAWVKPEKRDTQYLIKKATIDGATGVDGYELSLATDPSSQPPEGDGRAFVRFNQATSGNTYRLKG